MKLSDTKINQAGLMRCCLDTIETLPDDDYPDGAVVGCKHESAGNAQIVLRRGVWRWNSGEQNDTATTPHA